MAFDCSGGALIAVVSVIVAPFVVGYLYGFRHIDPCKYNGKVYYASSEVG